MFSLRSSLSEQSHKAARALFAEIDGARSVVVATADGFELAQAGPGHGDASRLAAMVSSFAALGDAASRESNIGTPRCLVIESTDGRLLVRCMQVRGQSIVVLVLADKKVLLGLVWHQLALAEKLMNAE